MYLGHFTKRLRSVLRGRMSPPIPKFLGREGKSGSAFLGVFFFSTANFLDFLGACGGARHH